MFGDTLVRFAVNIFPNWLNDLSLPALVAGTLSMALASTDNSCSLSETHVFQKARGFE